MHRHALDVPQLRDRTLDVALIRFAGPADQHRHADDFNVEILFNDELVIVAGKTSSWARDRRIDLAKLADALKQLEKEIEIAWL